MKRLLIGSLAAIFGSIIAACSTQKVAIDVKRPAASTDAARIKKIAVMHFNGPGGDHVAARLEAALAGAKVASKPFFDVTSAQSRAKAVGIHRTSGATGFDKEAARNIGRQLGVAGVYGGDIISNGVQSQSYSEQRSEPTGCSGKGFVQKCTGSRQYSVSCVRRKAGVQIAVRLVEVDSGRIAYANTHMGAFEDSACENREMRSENELLASAMEEAVRKIRNDVAPSEGKLQVAMFTEPKRMDGARRETFDSGVKWAKAGDIEKACEIWQRLEAEGARDPYLTFNLAICDESKGNIQSAVSRAQQAKDMSSDPDAALIEGHKRYAKLWEEQQALRSQGVTGRRS